jgi:serine/threonine protein kinase
LERFGKDIVLLERLAAGGMAEVYRGKHLGFGGFEKTVAIKRILPNFANSDEFKEMFRQEANLSAQLQNPNIVQIFSNGEFNGYLYLVMEFVNGKNVRQLISRAEKVKKKIPVEVACFIVAEAAKGLEYAHHFHDEKTGEELNIIHRDMSPQNIMLGYDGAVKIVDFGIAKAASRAEGTKAGVLKGKFGYMSPEQAGGMKLDRRTDVFSLGIILWELLTQKRLFSTDDDLQTLSLVRECNVPKPSKRNPLVTYALDKIVMKALAKEKSERYNSAGEMYADLIRYLNEKHSEFLPTHFPKYIKDLFAEVIEQEKKKREQINLQAPPILAEPRVSAAPAKERKEEGNKDRTQIDNDEETQLSVSVVQGSPLSPDDMVSPHLELKPISELESLTSEPQPELPPANLSAEGGPQPNAPKDFAETFELTNTQTRKMPGLKVNAEDVASLVKKSAAMAKKPNKRLRIYAVAAILLVLVIGLTSKQPGGNAEQNQAHEIVQGEVTQNVEGGEKSRVPSAPESTSEVRSPAITEGGPESLTPAEPVAEAGPAAPETSAAVPAQEIVNTPPAVAPAPEVAPEPIPAPTPLPELPKVVEAPPVPSDTPIYGEDEERAPSSLPGFVDIRSTPAATEIFVDGQRILDKKGNVQKTPVRNLKLKPGTRKIRIVNKAFGAYWEGNVEIQSDRLVKKDVILVNKLPK